MRDGEVGFFAREIGPTEVFRFSPVANDQFKIVGYNGAALTRSGPPGESVERKQAFDPWLMKEKTATTHHVAFRGSDGKYMAVGDDGRRVVFDACFPSLRPDKHKGLFILVPVRGQGTADELPESDDSGLGLKVHEFSHSMEHFRE
jgi:hypothetical protein